MMPIDIKQIDRFEDVLSHLPKEGNEVWAMVTTPADSIFVRLEAGELVGVGGNAVNLASAYEALFFSEAWQVSALRDGEAARLAITHPADKGEDEIDQQYLLWGSPLENGASVGWTILADPRIGEIDIPFAEHSKKEQRLVLLAKELVQYHPTGNAFVAGQRFTEIAVMEEKDAEI